MNKYRNKPVWLNRKTLETWSLLAPPSSAADSNFCNWSKFASILEATVYREIRTYFQEEWVALQPKLTLKEKSRYSSAVHYVSDFLIREPTKDLQRFWTPATNDDYPYRFIEAKGMMTAASKLKLQLMENILPHQRANLLIVSQEGLSYFGGNFGSSLTLKGLEPELINLREELGLCKALKT